MYTSPKELKEFVEGNPSLVTKKQSKRFPSLFVLKYALTVFYANQWHLNDLLLECRGLVVDADYNVIIKPFTKVFNYQENGASIPLDEVCTVARKINGFMACVTIDTSYTDDFIISTTGSLDSDFVDLARKHIEPLRSKLYEYVGDTKVSYLFEICDESDPHIIKEEYGAWLIGLNVYSHEKEIISSFSEYLLDNASNFIGCMRPETYEMKFSDVLEMNRKCEHEGFMVIGKDTTLKLKSQYYLLTKWLARIGPTKFNRMVRMGNKTHAYVEFDEEFYKIIDYVFSIAHEWLITSEKNRIAIIKEFLSRS